MADEQHMKTWHRWLIVLASFFSRWVGGMIASSLPFIYQELQMKFAESASATSGLFAVYNGLNYFLGEFC